MAQKPADAFMARNGRLEQSARDYRSPPPSANAIRQHRNGVTEAMIEQIGIVGAGTMGNGIAQVCAAAGLSVTMSAISEAALTRGMSVVEGSLERLVNKQKMTDADRQAAFKRIVTTTDSAKLANCDR